MYLSVTLKIAFSNFLSLRSFSASVALDSLHLLSCTKHSISVLRRSKPVILCIEALTLLALQKSSLATFSHWERSFSASLALHSLHLLSCTKHIISVLRSSNSDSVHWALTWLALQKSSNTWKSVFCIANNISFHEKKHLSCTWALILKLNLAPFSHWERSFSASLALHSLHLLVALNTALVFLALTALVFLALKKL